MPRPVLLALSALVLFLLAGRVTAQGLIWSIPEEGRWIRYEGTYTQIMRRPDAPTGDLTLKWDRRLTIKALNTEEVDVGGETKTGRWIELNVVTGPVREGLIDAGPGGVRLYKILVDPEAVQQVHLTEDGTVLDSDDVLATHVPILKGYRKIGNETAEPIETVVFQLYPVISLLQHYRTFSATGGEDVTVRDQTVTAEHLTGELTTEDAFTRAANTAEIWKTDSADIPFGIVKWQTTLTVERKNSTDPRSSFQELSELTEVMAAAEIGDAAESELVID